MGGKSLSVLFALILLTVVFSGCTEENKTEEQKLLGTWYDTSFSRQFTFYENKTVVYKEYHYLTNSGSYVAQPLLFYNWKIEDSMLHITDPINDITGFTEFSEDRMKIFLPESESKLNCFKVDMEKTVHIEIKEFSLKPEEIISGQNSNLKWSVTNATSIIITDNEGNEIKNTTSLYYKDSSGNLDVTSSTSKSFILKVSNFKFEETREIDLTVNEFIPESKIEDNISDIWQNKLVDDQWTYVLYQNNDKNYLDIIDISHSFDSSVITLTMTLNDNVESSLRVIYNMYIECQGKTYMGYYSNGVGSWSITSGVKTHDMGWLSNAVSGNTFTVSFDFENPDYYYTIWGKAYEIGDFGEMSESEWWGDYAPDSYAPWES